MYAGKTQSHSPLHTVHRYQSPWGYIVFCSSYITLVNVNELHLFLGKKPRGKAVAPTTPRQDAGLYWGYSVRLASSLSSVFTQCPYQGGYDLTIGTSERGSNVDDVTLTSAFKHGLIVFGGVAGLEASLEADEDLDIEEPSLLFRHYVNTCPGQGSNTIRTEVRVDAFGFLSDSKESYNSEQFHVKDLKNSF